jgi:GNAT superfamily N-acetyltransferase
MSTILLRRGVLGDLDAVMAIVKKAVPLMRAEGNFQWGDDYPAKENFAKDVENMVLWVAVDSIDENILGCGAITEDQGDDYVQLWDITQVAVVPHRICVDPDARGRGVARAFMRKAEEIARERGYKSVRVDTNSQNAPMHHIFNSEGYTFLGDLKLAGRDTLVFHGFEKIF